MSHCVTIVAVVSVLWHTMAGCCAHHRHDPPLESPGAPAHGHAVFHSHFGTDGHDHDPFEEGTPGAPCSPDSDAEACTFPTSSVRISIERDVAPTGYLPIAADVDASYGHHTATVAINLVELLGHDAPGALARHLALGVLQL